MRGTIAASFEPRGWRDRSSIMARRFSFRSAARPSGRRAYLANAAVRPAEDPACVVRRNPTSALSAGRILQLFGYR